MSLTTALRWLLEVENFGPIYRAHESGDTAWSFGVDNGVPWVHEGLEKVNGPDETEEFDLAGGGGDDDFPLLGYAEDDDEEWGGGSSW